MVGEASSTQHWSNPRSGEGASQAGVWGLDDHLLEGCSLPGPVLSTGQTQEQNQGPALMQLVWLATLSLSFQEWRKGLQQVYNGPSDTWCRKETGQGESLGPSLSCFPGIMTKAPSKN